MARGDVLVVSAFGESPLDLSVQRLPRPSALDDRPFRLQLGSRPGVSFDGDKLHLPAPSAAVLLR